MDNISYMTASDNCSLFLCSGFSDAKITTRNKEKMWLWPKSILKDFLYLHLSGFNEKLRFLQMTFRGI